MNFNPIIVLFLTGESVMSDWWSVLFQSYYSLISNSSVEIQHITSASFQSYYSLISNL